MSDCPRADVRDLLPDLVHGSLDETRTGSVEAHLRTCGDCRAEAALIGAMRGAMYDAAPNVDVARIAAAVRRTGASPRRARRPWRSAIGVVALAASLVAVAVLSRAADERPLGVPAVAPSGASPAPKPVATAPEPPVAPRPAGTAAAPAAPARTRTASGVGAASQMETQLSMGGGVADLDERQLEALLVRLEGVIALPDEAPAPALDTLGEEEG